MTRQRIYLETMERVLGSAEKVVIDPGSQGAGYRAVPAAQRTVTTNAGARAATAEREHAMKAGISGIVALLLLLVIAVVGYSALFTVRQTQQALVVRLGEPVRAVTEPGLNFKAPFVDTVIDIDKRILDLENPSQEVIASDQKRLVVDAFARYRIKDALRSISASGRSRPPTCSSPRC